MHNWLGWRLLIPYALKLPPRRSNYLGHHMSRSMAHITINIAPNRCNLTVNTGITETSETHTTKSWSDEAAYQADQDSIIIELHWPDYIQNACIHKLAPSI